MEMKPACEYEKAGTPQGSKILAWLYISKISKKLIGLITTYGAYFWHKHHKFCKLLIECLANNFISQYKSI